MTAQAKGPKVRQPPASSNRFWPAQSVLICGLKRSGTTVLWETLRKDASNLCFDEPFHRDLWKGKRHNNKGTWTELATAWKRLSFGEDPDLTPILPLDELDPRSTPQQRDYLRTLMLQGEQGEHTVIDEVRTWNRLPELLPGDVTTVVVHLLRDPANWVTAQMLPRAERSWAMSLRDAYEQSTFFRRRRDYDNWRYEEIIEAALADQHPIFTRLGLSCSELVRQPAYVKLLAFWWASNLETHSRLAQWAGGPVLTVTLSEFSARPSEVMERIYGAAGWRLSEQIDYSHVRSIRQSWHGGSRGWARAFDILGLPPELAKEGSLSSEAMAAQLSAHSRKKRLRTCFVNFAEHSACGPRDREPRG